MDKEEVYDEKIYPLMAQIIAICKERGIAMLATFAIPTENDNKLQVTTNLADETGNIPKHHALALNKIKATESALTMITETDASGGVKKVTAILG